MQVLSKLAFHNSERKSGHLDDRLERFQIVADLKDEREKHTLAVELHIK